MERRLKHFMLKSNSHDIILIGHGCGVCLA